LGGEIRVNSSPGEGSTFTLYLPRNYMPARSLGNQATAKAPKALSEIQAAWTPAETVTRDVLGSNGNEPAPILDDRSEIEEGDRCVLIVEDDVPFAKILLEEAREKGFKGLVATTGQIALALAYKFDPVAITLDIRLPDRDGWTILDRLKHDPKTKHIPVHIITVEEQRRRALRHGAFRHWQKPLTTEDLSTAFDQINQFTERGPRKLLLVEDDEVQRMSVVELIGNGDVYTTAVETGEEALSKLAGEAFDCMVLDLKLPDMTGFELIDKLQKDLGRHDLPIIVYTGK
jgi:CheY-like chemotaxis protein